MSTNISPDEVGVKHPLRWYIGKWLCQHWTAHPLQARSENRVGNAITGMADAIKGFFEALLNFVIALGLLLLLASLGSGHGRKDEQEKKPEPDKTPACCQVTVNLQTTNQTINEITPPVITRRPCPPSAAITDKKPATAP